MAAAIAAADDPDGVGHPEAEPPQMEATFTEDGPLGIVWSQVLDGVTLEYAYVKDVKPGSQAAKNPDMLPGLILGYVGSKWCQHMDYFDIVGLIRDGGRPLKLGFCGKIAATALDANRKAVAADPKTGRRASIATTGVGDYLGVKTFNVTQTHLKKVRTTKGLVRMVVGQMGLQIFDDKSPAPVETIRYEELQGGWQSGPGELILLNTKLTKAQMKLARSKGTTLKQGMIVLQTGEAADIEALMNEHALALESEKKVQEFAAGTSVATGLLASAAPGTMLHAYSAIRKDLQCVIALCPGDIKVYRLKDKVSRPMTTIPYEELLRFKRMRNPETKSQGILLECSAAHGGEMIFTVVDCNVVYDGLRKQIAKLVAARNNGSKPAARMPRMSVAVGSSGGGEESPAERDAVEGDVAGVAMAAAAAAVLDEVIEEGEEGEEEEGEDMPKPNGVPPPLVEEAGPTPPPGM
jgi:hypothetical protein